MLVRDIKYVHTKTDVIVLHVKCLKHKSIYNCMHLKLGNILINIKSLTKEIKMCRMCMSNVCFVSGEMGVAPLVMFFAPTMTHADVIIMAAASSRDLTYKNSIIDCFNMNAFQHHFTAG